MKEEEEKYLSEHGISPTVIRLLVLRSFNNATKPLSLNDLESELDTVDKSTISRTLNLFKTRGLLHAFNDGSGSMKYELCKSHNHQQDNDLHVHFRCEKCGETKCLTEIVIPEVNLPEGYVALSTSFIISGLCPGCMKTQQ